MGAKDTIMRDTIKRSYRVLLSKSEKRSDRWDIEGLLEEQAEISFEARQDEIDLLHSIINSKDVAITDLKLLLELAKDYAKSQKQAGIKEVVEWIETSCSKSSNNSYVIIFRNYWHAKLKEWGVTP